MTSCGAADARAVAAAWAFLQRHIPAAAFATTARWQEGKHKGAVIPKSVAAQGHVLQLAAAVLHESVMALPRSITIAPLHTHAMAARARRLGPLGELSTLSAHDASLWRSGHQLARVAGAVQFARMLGRPGAVEASEWALEEREGRAVEYQLVEAAPRHSDFARGSVRPCCTVTVRPPSHRHKFARLAATSLACSGGAHCHVCCLQVLPDGQGADDAPTEDVPAALAAARGLPFVAPSYAPLPGSNAEELHPAPPRLPSPENDSFGRPAIHVPDLATTSSRPSGASVEDVHSEQRGPGRYAVPSWLQTGGAGRATGFARGTGHAISMSGSSSGDDAAEGARLALHPSFDLVRRTRRHVAIARLAPGAAADTDEVAALNALRAQAALDRGPSFRACGWGPPAALARTPWCLLLGVLARRPVLSIR